MAAAPPEVRVREVGPRDGFQNEPEVIATDDKVRLIDMLAATGLPRLEVTSFVRPDVIPQLADAEEVLRRIRRPEGVSYSVLIPNERGLERALELRDRFDEVNLFLSASETHNRKNVNRSIAESLEGLARTIERAQAAELRCACDLGVVRLPVRGRGSTGSRVRDSREPRRTGCAEVSFGDTTGMANPRQVGEFFAAARERLPGVELTAHFTQHPRAGPANVLAALSEGVESFESAFGELGGRR